MKRVFDGIKHNMSKAGCDGIIGCGIHLCSVQNLPDKNETNMLNIFLVKNVLKHVCFLPQLWQWPPKWVDLGKRLADRILTQFSACAGKIGKICRHRGFSYRKGASQLKIKKKNRPLDVASCPRTLMVFPPHCPSMSVPKFQVLCRFLVVLPTVAVTRS